MDDVKQAFENGKLSWAAGKHAKLFDSGDAIAWYVFQANAYAAHREDCFEPEAFRIVPVFKRLGQLVPHLDLVGGAKDRARLLMTTGRRQPDDGLFELLIAGTYKRHAWKDVAFVEERPGVARTQDLFVSAPRRRWAVECKRVNRSGYEADEFHRGKHLASPIHELCKNRNSSLLVEVAYRVELSEIGDMYLQDRVEALLRERSKDQWDDAISYGRVREIDWRLARTVLQHDDIFFGSSRMIELLAGSFDHHSDYSVAADWVPARKHPLHATRIRQASVVRWLSTSPDAAWRKARHFRQMVARAATQLPGDCPGVVHVGYEAQDGNSVDWLRHRLNRAEMRTFDPGQSRLRWVYGNYLSPEHTNARNESAAISETTAAYKIGHHGTAEPLPSHLLFGDDPGTPGDHWRT